MDRHIQQMCFQDNGFGIKSVSTIQRCKFQDLPFEIKRRCFVARPLGDDQCVGINAVYQVTYQADLLNSFRAGLERSLVSGQALAFQDRHHSSSDVHT